MNEHIRDMTYVKSNFKSSVNRHNMNEHIRDITSWMWNQMWSMWPDFEIRVNIVKRVIRHNMKEHILDRTYVKSNVKSSVIYVTLLFD